MPRASADKTFINMVRGKNTESSPLAVPEGFARVLQNVDLDQNGTISRRLGIDFETDGTLVSEVIDGLPASVTELGLVGSSFTEWLVVDNDSNLNFYVVRIGNELTFHDMGVEAPSSAVLGKIDISSLAMDTTQSKKSEVSFSHGNGILLLTGELYAPGYITYDLATDVFTLVPIQLLERDFDGVDDGLNIDERPTTLTDTHKYNLKNQGWVDSRIATVGFPNNTDISYLGVKIDSGGNAVFDLQQLNINTFGNTPAPKGHYIIDALNKDRLAASGIFGLPKDDATQRRPAASEFYSGRAWYAGVNSKIYYSQILETLDKIGRCYQEQDPTAEDFNILLDTDGGVVHIPEMGQVLKLVTLDVGLLILTTNGVWQINGGQENFAAGTFVVNQVSDAGCIGADTVVKVDQLVMYWSGSGIYILKPDDVTGRVGGTNITEATIQSDYVAIPALGKSLANGIYDGDNRNVMWLYHPGIAGDTSALHMRKTHVLMFNTVLGAFYDYIIEDVGNGIGHTPFMSGIAKAQGRSQGIKIEFVTTLGNEVVTTTAGDPLITASVFDGTTALPIKVLTFTPDGGGDHSYTFSEFCSATFHDWFTFDGAGINYSSVVETAPETLGDLTRKKQATYIFPYFNRKRGGFGALIGTGRPDPSFGYRVTQNLIEVLRSGSPNSRVTQNMIEVLRAGQPNLRVTQNTIEILRNS